MTLDELKARPDFVMELGEQQKAFVLAFCSNGADKLAAARTATMPLAELNARLAKRLSILVSRDSTKEERHRTLRSTIAWSYDLLDAREAAVFGSLSVFGASFDIGGVCAVAQIPEEDALDVVE